MTRDELLRTCVERGVADESTVSAVSHLFSVFLLSALQRGQRVEIPDFGTFGTRVIGVKRMRRIPFFEPDNELADRCNERHRELKYVVVGKYEEVPPIEETEYKGKEAPHDPLVDHVGKEVVLDTFNDMSSEDYEAAKLQTQEVSPSKEKAPMPKFNLSGEETGGEKPEGEQEPILHESEDQDKGPGPLLQVLIAIIILALLTLALHFFGVIRLWGPSDGTQEAMAPPIVPEEVVETAVDTVVPETPTPVPVEPKSPVPSSGVGDYTVQVSSWQSRWKADQEVTRLTGANFDAFVEQGMVNGETWHRVRVGHYETRGEAREAASRLSQLLEEGEGAWVARAGR